MAGPDPSGGRAWRFVAPVALALCGALLATSALAADGNDLRPGQHTELTDLVRAEERRTEQLVAQVQELSDEVDDLTAEKADAGVEELRRQIDDLEVAAGYTAVEGPGLTVRLDDAPLPDTDEELAPGTQLDDYLVHQQDLEGVINALWTGGAEAMMVMDQRIVATSTIRCVGPVLLLQGRRYAPPYTITAIGDADAMLEALDDSDDVTNYRQYAELLDLGYQVDHEDSVTLPAYDGAIDVSGDIAP
ncbi:MAG TPA: DUF881 domain-containing protein [Jiangellaceae bacterium]|nr:DUF881 domain-containing protein [Jiangellaceae bacterium]